MIDAKSLLDRFLGAQAGGGGLARTAQDAMARAGGPGGFLGGAATGGVLGLLLGGKKMRKMAGGTLSHGGAAVLGALAYRAWQNWQQGKAPATSAPPALDATAVEPRFLPDAAPAADGQPFELALMRAMIAAANADGHIDGEERARIFEQVERLGFDPEAKAMVFDALAKPPGVSEVAAAARTPEQAAELYLAARLSVDPDHPAERAYLESLAHRMKLAPGLAAHLDQQAEAALREADGTPPSR